jgi:hypothetical protein
MTWVMVFHASEDYSALYLLAKILYMAAKQSTKALKIGEDQSDRNLTS